MHTENKRKQVARWGGYPEIGSAAWVRRETYKLAKKMEAGGSGGA